jgi:hypothetical protein
MIVKNFLIDVVGCTDINTCSSVDSSVHGRNRDTLITHWRVNMISTIYIYIFTKRPATGPYNTFYIREVSPPLPQRENSVHAPLQQRPRSHPIRRGHFTLPALVRLPPPHPHRANDAERAVVARSLGRVRESLVCPPDLHERRRRPGHRAASCRAGGPGGVRVEALGHGAVRRLDLRLRRRAADAQRLVQAPRRRWRGKRRRRRSGQRHGSRHELSSPFLRFAAGQGRVN